MSKVTPLRRQPPKTGTLLTLHSRSHMPIYYTSSIQHVCLPGTVLGAGGAAVRSPSGSEPAVRRAAGQGGRALRRSPW